MNYTFYSEMAVLKPKFSGSFFPVGPPEGIEKKVMKITLKQKYMLKNPCLVSGFIFGLILRKIKFNLYSKFISNVIFDVLPYLLSENLNIS